VSDLERIQRKESEVFILPVIKGLKSETEKVKEAFDTVQPDKVAISLSQEEVDGLRNIPEDYEPMLTRYDEIYAEGLSRFGEVAAPPPCYIAALELADHTNIEIVPIDIDEKSYTELYCAAVSGSNLFRHSTRTWILRRRKFGAQTAEDFVRAWDKAVNGLEGFRIIEGERTKSMAEGIRLVAKDAKRVLAIIELERAEDVARLLKEQ
jgi:hypothetical protein